MKHSFGGHEMWESLKRIMIVIVFLNFASAAQGQETVFSLFKNDLVRADQCAEEKEYPQAISLYKTLVNQSNEGEIELKIARSYHYSNKPSDASDWFGKALLKNKKLGDSDMYLYAESLSATGQYEKAIQWYNQCNARKTKDPLVVKKIWRLQNREYLFDDSAHYKLTPLSINSNANDMSALSISNDIIFLSNRNVTGMNKEDRGEASFFYKLYYSKMICDTVNGIPVHHLDKPKRFSKTLEGKYHEGPITLYGESKKLIYTANGAGSEKDKNSRTLQLFFAEFQNKEWKMMYAFPFNSTAYSITDPAISEDGLNLYFSSDMPGGYGGKDLYKSVFKNNAWTRPYNLGEQINTSGNEGFPFLIESILYFTSTGHPGLGGMDIFKTTVLSEGFGEVLNMGYPINTNFDDFALTLNKGGVEGYISSNRNRNNDDLFALTIDIQTFPLVIECIVKYKEDSWDETTDLKILPKAQLSLIDNRNNRVIQSTVADANGKFTLTIPYFSQYKIKVVSDVADNAVLVSLDISKSRNAGNQFEIVVVKNKY
ncbi:MAG: tetratricopeptide repeat protein [Chryseolinea sp.]